MKTFKLSAEPRLNLGKKATKELRKEGKVPVVLNGGKVVDLPFADKLDAGEKLVELEGGKKGVIVTDLVVNKEDLRKLIYTPDIFVVELTTNGKTKNVIIKDMQFEPVHEAIMHIDFLEVDDSKPVVMEVPVKIEGHSEGVKAGGKLSLSMRKLKVRAIYTNMPERVVVNVDKVQLGQSLKVGDLHYDSFELVSPKNAVVCAVQLTRAAKGDAADAAAATPAAE